jgi:primosomal replication protein N
LNRVTLAARLLARAAVRYTPAGLPVIDLSLRHAGTVVEAQLPRQLDFELAAVALGEAAQRLSRVALGAELQFDGFLAPRTRRSKTLVLHITDYRTV